MLLVSDRTCSTIQKYYWNKYKSVWRDVHLTVENEIYLKFKKS